MKSSTPRERAHTGRGPLRISRTGAAHLSVTTPSVVQERAQCCLEILGEAKSCEAGGTRPNDTGSNGVSRSVAKPAAEGRRR